MSTASSGPQTAQVATLVDKQSAAHYKRLRSLKGDVRRRIRDGALETAASRADFLSWFQNRLRSVLALSVGASATGALTTHYTSKFIDSAFASGWRAGALALASDGRRVDVPRSMDVVEEQISASTPGPRRRRDDLRDTQREQLDEIATDLRQELIQIVRESLEVEVTRDEAASSINRRVDVAITRSRRTADYELSRTYNVASAERMRTRGVFSVNIVNPTGGCPETCAPRIADNPYPINEAVSGRLCPFHPHCRCTLEVA